MPSDVIIDYRNRIFLSIEEATQNTTGGPLSDRLKAALTWVDLASKWAHPSSLEAYRRSLELLQLVLAAGNSLESRHLRLTSVALEGTQNLAVDGAASAIGLGRVEMALELLEQGRSLLLTQAGRYRTAVDNIEDTLAHEFRAISAKMENSAMNTKLEDINRAFDWATEDVVAV